MSSGVKPNAECIPTFQELKTGKKLKYIIYGLSDDKKSIVVLKTSQEQDFEAFIKDLPEAECRWAVYDYEFNAGEGVRNKIAFVMWSPDDANVKNKMLFASSKDALRRALEGIQIEVQATEYSEITKDALHDKATRR